MLRGNQFVVGVPSRLDEVVSELDLSWSTKHINHDVTKEPFKRPLMGMRTKKGLFGRAILQGTPPQERGAIYEAIHEQVLTDEMGLTPSIVYPPEPEAGITSLENNTLWLDCIEKGIWPIMMYPDYKSRGDRLAPYEHDYASEHPAVSGTLPLEMSWRVRRVAAIERARRERGIRGALLLEGENPLDWDDFSYGVLGSLTRRMTASGIDLLDNVTDTPKYLAYVRDMATHPDPQATQEALRVHIDETRGSNDGSVHGAAKSPLQAGLSEGLVAWASDIQRCGVALANFISRHEQGRDLDVEERQVVEDEVIEGAFRVAMKIRGDWREPIAA